MIGFIEDQRVGYGVESICRVLPIAPSTFYHQLACRSDPSKASARHQRDTELRPQIKRVWGENYQVYGVRKAWHQLKREGFTLARCTVERLMKQIGIRGAVRGKVVKTTVPDTSAPCPRDKVNRVFRAPTPNLLWVTEDDYARCFDVNVKGTLLTMQAVARRMIERGQGGKMINMASQAGRRGEPLVAVYCASKAAVISLTQSAGLGLIGHGINVNAISPGVVDGEHWDGVDAFFARYENKTPGQKKREVGAAVPFGRMGTAQDLTGMAVFLASDAADYIVAQTYNVDGGQWMS